jgi:hypothetical protein
MILPLDEPRVDEVFSLLYGENGKESSFAQNLLEHGERARDFLPLPVVVPSFQLEWTHKKGKRKPQQFWIYCEESQQNYVRVHFAAPTFTWTTRSVVKAHRTLPDVLVLVEDYIEDPALSPEGLRCLMYAKDQKVAVEHVFLASDLSDLPEGALAFQFQVRADNAFPLHPQQGKPDQLSILQHTLPDRDAPFPFSHVGCFTFKNREEGWFRLQATLLYQGAPVFTGESDLFMFNNPRMKCKKHLALFTPAHIKFMQVYSLTPQPDQDYWFDLALQLGFGAHRALQLLQLAGDIFAKSSSQTGTKAVTIKQTAAITGANGEMEFVLASAVSPSASPLKKRPQPTSSRTSPAKKSPRYASNDPTAVRAWSLPAMTFTVGEISPSPVVPEAYTVRRADTGPSGSPIRTRQTLHGPLAQCQTVTTLLNAPFAISYQFLTSKLTLESTKLYQLACDRSISIDQLTLRIEQDREEGGIAGRHRGTIRHLYSLRDSRVVELTDTMDVHAVLSSQSSPIILVSAHDDEELPPRALFSSGSNFRPRPR